LYDFFLSLRFFFLLCSPLSPLFSICLGLGLADLNVVVGLGFADLGVVVGLGFWMVEWVIGVVDFGFDFDFG
jgi:hypothetical protein